MSINCSKTVFSHITNSQVILQYDYSVQDQRLERVHSFKYLGVTIQSNLKWDNHINEICSKARCRLWMLKRKLKYSTREVKLTAYKTLVRPLLEYSSVVWDPYTVKLINKIEQVQRLATRFIISNFRRTASVTLFWKTWGWRLWLIGAN